MGDWREEDDLEFLEADLLRKEVPRFSNYRRVRGANLQPAAAKAETGHTSSQPSG